MIIEDIAELVISKLKELIAKGGFAERGVAAAAAVGGAVRMATLTCGDGVVAWIWGERNGKDGVVVEKSKL